MTSSLAVVHPLPGDSEDSSSQRHNSSADLRRRAVPRGPRSSRAQSIFLGTQSLGLDNCGAFYSTAFSPFNPKRMPSRDTVAREFNSHASAIGNPTQLHGDGSGYDAHMHSIHTGHSGGGLHSSDASILRIKPPTEEYLQTTALTLEEAACLQTTLQIKALALKGSSGMQCFALYSNSGGDLHSFVASDLRLYCIVLYCI